MNLLNMQFSPVSCYILPITYKCLQLLTHLNPYSTRMWTSIPQISFVPDFFFHASFVATVFPNSLTLTTISTDLFPNFLSVYRPAVWSTDTKILNTQFSQFTSGQSQLQRPKGVSVFLTVCKFPPHKLTSPAQTRSWYNPFYFSSFWFNGTFLIAF